MIALSLRIWIWNFLIVQHFWREAAYCVLKEMKWDNLPGGCAGGWMPAIEQVSMGSLLQFSKTTSLDHSFWRRIASALTFGKDKVKDMSIINWSLASCKSCDLNRGPFDISSASVTSKLLRPRLPEAERVASECISSGVWLKTVILDSKKTTMSPWFSLLARS